MAASAADPALFAKHWKISKDYALAVARAMPADAYAFKPNPAEMSFAEQLAHIAGSNGFFFSRISGKKAPFPGKLENMDKDSVIKRLTESFDWSIETIQALTPEQLAAVVKTPMGELSGAEALMLAMDHTTHHRGQCVVYLRVKNITPPDYKFGPPRTRGCRGHPRLLYLTSISP